MTNMYPVFFTFISNRCMSCAFMHSENIFLLFLIYINKKKLYFLCINHKYLSPVFSLDLSMTNISPIFFYLLMTNILTMIFILFLSTKNI